MKTKPVNIPSSFHTLAIPYVLGELPAAGRKRVDALVAQKGSAYATELTALEAGLNLLPTLLLTRTPSPAVKERLMNRARAIRPAMRPRTADTVGAAFQRSTSPTVWITAAFALVLVAGLMFQINRMQQELARQGEELTLAEKKADELKTQLDAGTLSQQALDVLLDPTAKSASLAGLAVSPQSSGKITWVNNRAVLHVANLPASAAKEYELWIIKGSQKIPAGVFAVGSGDEEKSLVKVLPMDSIEQIDAFAVTLEPRGGVQVPTGDVYLLGKPGSSPR